MAFGFVLARVDFVLKLFVRLGVSVPSIATLTQMTPALTEGRHLQIRLWLFPLMVMLATFCRRAHRRHGD
jgi:hypothetical protein